MYRLPGERIEIGDVTVRIGRMKGRQVQVVIDAPASIRIRKPTKAGDLADRLIYADRPNAKRGVQRGD